MDGGAWGGKRECSKIFEEIFLDGGVDRRRRSTKVHKDIPLRIPIPDSYVIEIT